MGDIDERRKTMSDSKFLRYNVYKNDNTDDHLHSDQTYRIMFKPAGICIYRKHVMPVFGRILPIMQSISTCRYMYIQKTSNACVWEDSSHDAL